MKTASLVASEQKQLHALRVIWLLVASLLVVDFVWMYAIGWSIDWQSFWIRPIILAVGLPFMLWCRYWEVDINACVFVQVHMQLVFLATGLIILSYLGASLNLPLQDDAFIAMDTWLGFDWLAYIGWLNDRPMLAHLLKLAYASMLPQMLILPALLLFYRKTDHVIQYVLIYFISAAITIVIASLWPAVAGYVHYKLTAADFPNINPFGPFLHQADVQALREGSLRIVSSAGKGIVTFPSFHATLGVIFTYLCSAMPWLFSVGIALNALMIVSAIGDGGHYLSDVIAGVIVGIGVIALVRRLYPLQTLSAATAE